MRHAVLDWVCTEGIKKHKGHRWATFKKEMWMLNYDININFPNCDSLNEVHYCKEITLNYLGQKGMMHATYFQVERESVREFKANGAKY